MDGVVGFILAPCEGGTLPIVCHLDGDFALCLPVLNAIERDFLLSATERLARSGLAAADDHQQSGSHQPERPGQMRREGSGIGSGAAHGLARSRCMVSRMIGLSGW